MAKSCKALGKALDSFTRYIANSNYVRDSDFLQQMIGKKKNLTDKFLPEISKVTEDLGKFNNEMKKFVPASVTGKSPIFEKYTAHERRALNMLHEGYKSGKELISYEKIMFDGRERFSDHLKKLNPDLYSLLQETGMTKRWTDMLFDSYDIFTKGNYDFKALIRFMNTGDFFDSLYLKLSGSLKTEISSIPAIYANEKEIKGQTDYEEMISKWIMNHLEETEGIHVLESERKHFLDDMLGKGLFSGSKFETFAGYINNVRALQAPLKYTNIQAGPMMLMQNTLVNTAKLISMKAGQIVSSSDPVIKHLMENESFLKSEGRALSDISVETELGETFLDASLKKVFGENSKTRVVLEGGVMGLYDVVMDNTVKKNSIARALSKLKIDPQLILDGKISKEEMNKLRAFATTFYSEFFGNSQLRFLSRNKFSRWLPINAMQNYMFQMTGQAFFAVNDFLREFIKSDKTWGSFVKLLDDPKHQEFKTLVHMSLITGKIAVYMDSILNPDASEEGRAKKIMTYMKSLHEYWAAVGANFFGRMLDSFGKSINQIEYLDKTGEKVTMSDGISITAYNGLNTLVSSLFREFNVFNIPATTLNAYLNKGLSLEDALDMGMIEYTKLSSGLNKYNLVPGFETFDLKAVKQKDDMFGYLLTSLPETNESMKVSNFLRDISNVEDYIHGKGQEKWSTLFNTLAYLPILKAFGERGMTDMRYSKILQLTESDPYIIDLYNGKWNEDYVNVLDSKTLFTELTAFDLRNKKLDEDMKNKLSAYGLTEMKGELFANLLADKLGDANLKSFINQYSPDVEKMNVAKILAFAESEVPGSGRVMLSYLADQYVYNRTKQLNEQKGFDKYGAGKSVNLSVEEQTQIQKEAINLLYPHMYVADKTSWFKLISQRCEQLDKELFVPKGSKSMDSTLANTLAMSDMIAYQQAKSGEGTNAQYIKSVFNLMGKNISDPVARSGFIMNAFETMSSLNTNDNVKNTMKTGMLLGNVDFLDKLQKDEKFMKANGPLFNNLMNILFGHLEKTNIGGIDGLRVITDDLNSAASVTSGKKYTPNQFNNGNYKALDSLNKAANGFYPSIKSGAYNPSDKNNTVRYPYDVSGKYTAGNPQPKQYDSFVKFYDEFKKVTETQTLVHGYVNKTPEELRSKATFKYSYTTPKYKTIAHTKIPKKQFYYKQKNVNYD